MARVEVKVPQTEFELGVPEEKKEEAKLQEEQKEVKKGLKQVQTVLAKKKLARKKDLLERLKKLTKIKTKKLHIIDTKGRARLLKALIEKKKRPVSVLRKVSDTIPNVLIKRREEEIKPTFLKKGGLI